MCTKDIHGRQYSRSIPSINILINIWSTSWSIHVKTLSTLDQQSVDSRPSGHQLVWINRKLVNCWPTVDWDVDGVSSVNQGVDEVLIEYRSSINQVQIKGIDWGCRSTLDCGCHKYTWSRKLSSRCSNQVGKIVFTAGWSICLVSGPYWNSQLRHESVKIVLNEV